MWKSCVLGLVGTALLAISCSKKDPAGEETTEQGTGGYTNNIIVPTTGGSSGEEDAGEGGAGVADPCRQDLIREDVAAQCWPQKDAGAGADADACAAAASETENPRAILQLVIDVSSSMKAKTDSTLGRTKWEVTRDALIKSLQELASTIAVGITFFPNKATPYVNTGATRPIEECIDTSANVPIAPLGPPDSPHRTALIDRLQAMIPADNAGTPTHDAYDLALAPLLEPTLIDPTADAGNVGLPGPRYVLLITDGQPTYDKNCLGTGSMATWPLNPQPIIDAISTAVAAEPSVKTYVIGSPGSEKNEATGDDVRWWLSQAARAGGTPSSPTCDDTANFCHFDMTTAPDFADALAKGLREILGQVVSCNYNFSVETGLDVNPAMINVSFTLFDGTKFIVPKNAKSDDCNMGWRLINDNTAVAVCGSTCQAIQKYPEAKLEVYIGCTEPPTVF